MSKPTHKQKQVIAAIQELLIYWESSNDVHSPSHGTDIHDVIDSLVIDDLLTPEGVLTSEEALAVKEPLFTLLSEICELSKCSLREEVKALKS